MDSSEGEVGGEASKGRIVEIPPLELGGRDCAHRYRDPRRPTFV